MEVEPWEALDLDDSDLPALLRPCKRRRSTSPTTAAASTNPLSRSPSSKTPEEIHLEERQQQPLPSTSLRRTIPGPAGAVQAAILHKNIDRGNQSFTNFSGDNGGDFNTSHRNNEVVSTQDYIRRAMEDTAEFDDDFNSHSWVSAIQCLGAENGRVQSMPINSIKKCLNAGKVAQVVAVIKSCTPNGLGGLMVLLKDPTGTVGASIHHKVLSESEFAKNLTIGAVLILREVAIFAPARSAHYLNITLKNLVKVFSQNSGSTTKLNNSAYSIQYAEPGYCGKAKTMEKMSIVQNVPAEDIDKRQRTRKAENLHNISVIQRRNLSTRSVQSENRASINVRTAQRGHINLGQDTCTKISEDIIKTRITTADHQKFVNGSNNSKKGGNSKGSLNGTDNMADSVTKSIVEDIQGSNEAQMQKQAQPPMLRASVPEWTDEQLDELFAADEDDSSLF
ncbi:hypothetical protein CDL12_06761 [Handroanthus impetiginosus]|uniref:Homologous recombination OB-fold protein OB-fold domain-containing protein n=1 Tax=Handroanthus impetiginosus TaxID=429701 RepID=A0A2G9HSX2_9LAMI|nr:hypothetical protein CDL12_06761 [Handroanthus impetiginosus]